jgi:hypothetical protein
MVQGVRQEIERFSIWRVLYPFDETGEGKERPALVFNQTDDGAVCLRMTSKPQRAASDLVISRWREAGLDRETTINTTRREFFRNDELIRKIGNLHDDDIYLLLFRHFTST